MCMCIFPKIGDNFVAKFKRPFITRNRVFSDKIKWTKSDEEVAYDCLMNNLNKLPLRTLTNDEIKELNKNLRTEFVNYQSNGTNS